MCFLLQVFYLLIDFDCKTAAVPLPAGFIGVMRADFMSQMPHITKVIIMADTE